MVPQKSEKKETDIILIRHAESEWNDSTTKITEEIKWKGHWRQLIKDNEFYKQLTFSRKFIDTPLSEKGQLQCQKYSKGLQNTNIDLILVSPQMRALQTCKGLFGGRHIPVRAEPLLMQKIGYGCDVSIETSKKKQMFPDYDFSKVVDLGDNWSLQILPKQLRQLAYKKYEKSEADNVDKRQEVMLQLLKNKQITEPSTNLRERVAKLKQKLKELKKQFPVIAIVSHYFTIQFIKAKQFDEDSNLLGYEQIQNCRPYFESLDELSKVQ